MATEKRLIAAKELERQIKEAFEDSNPVLMGQMLRWIRKQPKVDAVEVKHGRWDKNWSGDNIVYCNQCYMPQDVPTPFCASCGAKMDGDGNG